MKNLLICVDCKYWWMRWKTWYNGLSGLLTLKQPYIAKFVWDGIFPTKEAKGKGWSHSIFCNELVLRTSLSLLLMVTSLQPMYSTPVVCIWRLQSGSCKQCWQNELLLVPRALQFFKSLSVSKCFHHIQECPGHSAGPELVYTNELPFALQLSPTI